MADEDTGYGSKAESDSIGNQRMLINRFLDNHPELSHCQRSESVSYTHLDVYKRQVESKCKKCGRITVFDVLNMRRLRPRTK